MAHLKDVSKPRNALVGAITLALAASLLPSAALAREGIGGQYYPSGTQITSNVTLTQPATIVAAHLNGKRFCIISDQARPFACFDSGSDAVGVVLPAGSGYFATAEPHLRNGYAEIQIRWEY